MAAATKPTSSYQTYLMHDATGSGNYAKLVDIKDFGDLGGTPETLETTSLSDKSQTNILGIQSMDTMEFTCNYIPGKYQELVTLAQSTVSTPGKFAVWFGAGEDGEPDGHDGKFSFDGQLSVFVSGKGVNEVREMTVSVAATTEVTFAI